MVKDLSISEAFEVYRVEHIVYLNQSKRTAETSLNAMNLLVKFAGDIPVTQLSFDLIRKWKEHLERTKGQNTVRCYIIKLRVVLKHLQLRGYEGIINPEMVGVPKRQDRIVEFVTPEEVNKLIDTAFTPVSGYKTINRYRNRAIISLLYASGVRVSEMCSLNRATIKDDLTFTVMGKGGKARLCFIDTRTQYCLQSYLELRKDKNPALFISDITGDRITANVTQMMFANVTKKAGFTKPIHPHTMRHSFATNLLRNNTNLLYVRDFLGHTSVQTTEMYTHIVNQDLKDIYTQKHTI